ncbi:unnamed protein product [Diamesa tonsa]
MSNIQKKMLKSRLPPMVPRSSSAKNHPGRQKDYSPLEWNSFFHDYVDCEVDDGTFRIYRTKQPEVLNFPVIVLLHGGGYSGLSWAAFSTEITQLIHCQCLAIDFRGHGDTKTTDEENLSAEILASDIGKVIAKLYPNASPNIIIVGHSMGGAICVHIADMKLIPSLMGIAVIDVVEGTAMDSLQSMQSFLRSRPTHFKSIPHAIEWCVRSGQIRNIESAKVSMPGQIINCETQMLATNELPLDDIETPSPGISNPLSIPENEEETDHPFKAPLCEINLKKYTWRIDLSKSEKFWSGWFNGLSEKFLNLLEPKLLILAGIDNLDKSLTVGQMQGKFQLQVLARTGHAVHEDRPHEVAEVIASYLIRNRFAEASGDFVRQLPAC